MLEVSSSVHQGSGIEVRGPNSTTGVALGVEADGFPSVTVRHGSGRTAVLIGADAARTGEATIALLDDSGKQHCMLTLSGDGDGHLSFSDRNNQPRVRVGVAKNGQGVVWADEGAHPRRANKETELPMRAMRRWMRTR